MVRGLRARNQAPPAPAALPPRNEFPGSFRRKLAEAGWHHPASLVGADPRVRPFQNPALLPATRADTGGRPYPTRWMGSHDPPGAAAWSRVSRLQPALAE